VVISDATCSPGESHAAGLARLRDAGAVITDTKGLFYEWMRTVERSRRFDQEHPVEGLALVTPHELDAGQRAEIGEGLPALGQEGDRPAGLPRYRLPRRG
jgi:hypothetical protein